MRSLLGILFLCMGCVTTSINRTDRHEKRIEVCDNTGSGKHYVYHHAQRQVKLNRCYKAKYIRLDDKCAVVLCDDDPFAALR